jgi:hypothetical protein
MKRRWHLGVALGLISVAGLVASTAWGGFAYTTTVSGGRETAIKVVRANVGFGFTGSDWVTPTGMKTSISIPAHGGMLTAQVTGNAQLEQSPSNPSSPTVCWGRLVLNGHPLGTTGPTRIWAEDTPGSDVASVTFTVFESSNRLAPGTYSLAFQTRVTPSGAHCGLHDVNMKAERFG